MIQRLSDEETKTIPTNFNEKKATCKTQIFYILLPFLSFTIALLIVIKKNRTYYFFDHIINIKNSDRNDIKIDEMSYKDILIYYIEYVTIKDSKYVKISSVNPLYLIFSKVNGN